MIPCKSYVDITYLPYFEKEAAIKKFTEESRNATYDFVECLAYSTNEYVVMLGILSFSKNYALVLI